MALALGRLRITPRDFWLLSVPELDALLRGAFPREGRAAAPLDAATLDALCVRFPD